MKECEVSINRIGNDIYFYLLGRIDSANSQDLEKCLFSEKLDSFEKIYIDIENLGYISSAGLRVLLKLQKLLNNKLVVKNVKPDIYEIFETTGFNQILNIEKKLREISIEGCEIIGKGGYGIIYKIDDETIVKMYEPDFPVSLIKEEQEYAKKAFVKGIPTAIPYDIVKCGDKNGLVFELINSDNLARVMMENPDNIEEYAKKYTDLLKILHKTEVNKGEFREYTQVMHGYVRNMLDLISKDDAAILDELIDCIPEKNTLIHGDFHPGNVMTQGDEVLLIDMADLSRGNPVLDLAAVYRDIVSAPKNKFSKDNTIISSEIGDKLWELFCRNYLETEDSKIIEEFTQKISLVFAFNAVLCLGMKSRDRSKFASLLLEVLYKGVVVPKKEVIKQILKSFN